MGSFICRQPNGLLCRFSTVVDCVTDYNMTDEEYIEMCAEMAREDARVTIKKNLKPFSWIKKETKVGVNISRKQFNEMLKHMGCRDENTKHIETKSI